MPEDLVSIITPSFNSAEFIGDTIRSIQAQSYNNWELLITDDCSSDNTVELVKEYAEKDHRIKLFQLEKNAGPGVARNNSIREAAGRYIAFCDSDDRWMPDKLRMQVDFMKANDIGLCYGSYLVCDENNKEVSREICIGRMSFFRILSCNVVGCLTAIYDVSKVGKLFMPSIKKRQDWALWIKVLRNCRKGLGIQQPIAIYRDRKNSVSSNKLKLFKYHPLVYRDVLGVPIFAGYLLTIFFNMPAFIFKTCRSKWINRRLRFGS